MHLVTAHGMVTAILFLTRTCLLGGDSFTTIFAEFFTRQGEMEYVQLAAPWVFLWLLYMMLQLPPGDSGRSVGLKAAGLLLSAGSVWTCLWTCQEHAPSSYGARIRYSIAMFFAFGFSEHIAHSLLGDGDRNLILRHRQGWRERFDGLMTDVVLPGPIIFWSLHLADLLGWPPVHVPRP